MRLRVLSDLHLEFDGPSARAFIGSLDPEIADGVILAGDICVHSNMVEAMRMLCQHFGDTPVIWVHGNHEFYGSDRRTIMTRTEQVLSQNENLHFLDCGVVEIKGQRFIGAPLWFKWDDANPTFELFMNDFRVIQGLRDWVYDECLSAVNYIEGHVDENDVVITHHLPSARSVAPRFRSSDLNRFFLCELDGFIRRRGPKLWVHGHTHDSFDYQIEHDGNTRATTRVVCNPRGYFPDDLNPDFNRDLVVEI